MSFELALVWRGIGWRMSNCWESCPAVIWFAHVCSVLRDFLESGFAFVHSAYLHLHRSLSYFAVSITMCNKRQESPDLRALNECALNSREISCVASSASHPSPRPTGKKMQYTNASIHSRPIHRSISLLSPYKQVLWGLCFKDLMERHGPYATQQ